MASRAVEPADVPSRVGLTAVLALAMGSPPLLLYGVSALSPLVLSDLALTRSQLGLLASVAFAWAAVFSLKAGFVVTRLGEQRSFLLVLWGSAAAVLVAALSRGYVWLLAAGAICGFVQALSNPLTNVSIARHVWSGRRGAVVGVKQSGVQAGQAVAAFTLPPLALIAGWRAALVVCALLLFASGLLPRRFIGNRSKDSPSQHPVPTLTDEDLPSPTWLFGYVVLVGAAVQATNIYLPLFGYQRLSMPLQLAGTAAGVAAILGIASRIALGRLSERTTSPNRLLSIGAVGGCVGAVLLGLSSYFTNRALLWLGVLFHGCCAMAMSAVVMMLLVRRVQPSSLAGSTASVSGALFVGFTAGPFLFGTSLAVADSYTVGWLLAATAHFLAAALVQVRAH